MSEKDSAAKNCFEDPVIFADACNGILYKGEQVVDPDDLEKAENEYLYFDGNAEIKTTVDVAKRWKSKDTTIAVILLESQSETDYSMVLRSMITQTIGYYKQLKLKKSDHKRSNDLTDSAEFLSGISKEDRFEPIITIVIYHGRDPWDGPRDLHGLLRLDDKLKPFVPNISLNLYDYHEYSSFNEFKTELSLAFEAFSCQEDKKRLLELMHEKGQLVGTGISRFIAKVLNIKNLSKYTRKDAKGEERTIMCTAIEELIEDGRIEGRTKGRIEGRTEGRNGLLQGALANGSTPEQIAAVLGIPIQEILDVQAHLPIYT